MSRNMARTGSKRAGRPLRSIAASSLALALMLAACASDDDGDGSGDGDAASADDDGSDGEVEGQSFEINFGSALPASTLLATQNLAEMFVPEVTQRVADETPHELEINEHFGTIVGVGEELTGLEARQLDMGSLIFAYHPGELPMHQLGYYVPFSSPEIELTTQAWRMTWDEVDEFSQVVEDHNQVALAFFGVGDYGLGTVEDWSSLDDLDGLDIAGVGPNLEWLEGTGANPIQAPAGEWYTSFQTGVFDGGINFIDGMVSLRLYEVIDYFTDIQFGSVPLGIISVNQDAWDELPEDVQQVIRDVAEEWEQDNAADMQETINGAYDVMEEEGMTIKRDEDLRRAWAEAVSALPQSKADELNEQGLPGSKLIRTYIEAQQELGYEFPVDYEIE